MSLRKQRQAEAAILREQVASGKLEMVRDGSGSYRAPRTPEDIAREREAYRKVVSDWYGLNIEVVQEAARVYCGRHHCSDTVQSGLWSQKRAPSCPLYRRICTGMNDGRFRNLESPGNLFVLARENYLDIPPSVFDAIKRVR